MFVLKLSDVLRCKSINIQMKIMIFLSKVNLFKNKI